MAGRRRGKKRHQKACAESHDGLPAVLRPGRPERDLLGRAPVRLRVEGDLLVGYGFGRRRTAIPRSSVKELGTYFHPRSRGAAREGLVVLDAEDRMLLKAPGVWEHAARGDFARQTGLPRPRFRTRGHRRRPIGG